MLACVEIVKKPIIHCRVPKLETPIKYVENEIEENRFKIYKQIYFLVPSTL